MGGCSSGNISNVMSPTRRPYVRSRVDFLCELLVMTSEYVCVFVFLYFFYIWFPICVSR
jgi:hypothetical protein